MTERCDTYTKAMAAEAEFEAALAANPGSLRYIRSQDNDTVRAARLAYYQAMDEWRDTVKAAFA